MAARRYRFEQFYAIRRHFGNLAFSPDGQRLVYVVDTSGQFNLWRQPATGGWPDQLTLFDQDATRAVAWSPDGARLLFNADRDGTEKYQLYELPAEGGWPERLTDRPDVQYLMGPEGFSPDGRRFAYAANERSQTDVDVLLRDLATGEVRPVLAGNAFFTPAAWSPDGRYLLAVDVRSNTDQDVHLLDLATGDRRHLTPHEGEVVYEPGPWAADGSGFYLLSDLGREHRALAFYDLRHSQMRWVETPEWNVELLDGSRDGRYLAWVVNEEGWSRLFVRHLPSDQTVDLPALPPGVIQALAFAPNGSRLALRLTGPTRPADVYVLDLEAADAGRQPEARQITFSMLGGIPPEAMVEPELVRYPTFDGRRIPAFLFRPRDASPSSPVPVVLSIHGGPEAQERPIYTPLYQYLLSQGIGVLAPNIRGSTGYGKSYQQLIHRDWGGGELRDLEAAAQYLRSLEWVDPTRIGVFGGSFGGFATLSAVSRLPDYWAAAVDIVGPSNLITFVRAVPPTWRRFMAKWVGDPEEDRDLLIERSPITFADQIRAPLLVIQGANDPRVVKGESDQMVERLRARGVPVEYLVFEDEGHGFTRRANQLRAFRATADFFVRHLLPGAAT